MMDQITQESFFERYYELNKLINGIHSRWREIRNILIDETGLTEMGVESDRILMLGHLKSLKSDIHHLIGRKRVGNKVYGSIPYDTPNFLVMQYTGATYLAGYDVTLHFAKGAKHVGDIWKEEIENNKIKNYRIDTKYSGIQFGRKALEDDEIRHLIIAGGTKVYDYYDDDEKIRKMNTITVFGPTRPKSIFLSDKNEDDIDLKNTLAKVSETSMMNSGQICALDKEIITTADNRDIIVDTVTEHIDFYKESGKESGLIGPILDKPAFEKGIEIIKRIRSDPMKMGYQFLVDPVIDMKEQYISPFLVEAPNGVESDIDGFFPYLLINTSATNDEEALRQAELDTIHGGYAFIHTNDTFKAFDYQKHLHGGHYGKVLANANIMNYPIGQPYGGYKKSYTEFRNLNGNILRVRGNHFQAHNVTN